MNETMVTDWIQKKRILGQYFSSKEIADLMASMMSYRETDINILDPGAGDGSLAAACIRRICSLNNKTRSISVTLCEIDDTRHDVLAGLMSDMDCICKDKGISLKWNIDGCDFILASNKCPQYTHVIMNPPYKKITTSSDTYTTLKKAGIKTTNLYTAFVSIACKLLLNGGNITFITPRSFCNGLYFHGF